MEDPSSGDFYDAKTPFLGAVDYKRQRPPESCLKPTSQWSRDQRYFLIENTIITSIICFGVNFGLATVAMYSNEPPTLFQFPIPMCGNFAITIGLELTMNWWISNTLMSRDVLSGKVAPLNPQCIFFWPRRGSSAEWWLNCTEVALPTIAGSPLCPRMKSHASRVLPWIALFMLTLLPISTGVSYLVWGLDNYKSFPWQGEIMTGVLGVVIVLFTIPFWATMVLGSIGLKCLEQ